MCVIAGHDIMYPNVAKNVAFCIRVISTTSFDGSAVTSIAPKKIRRSADYLQSIWGSNTLQNITINYALIRWVYGTMFVAMQKGFIDLNLVGIYPLVI